MGAEMVGRNPNLGTKRYSRGKLAADYRLFHLL